MASPPSLAEPLTVPKAVDRLWFYPGLPPWRTLADMGSSWSGAEAFSATEAKRVLLTSTPPGSGM